MKKAQLHVDSIEGGMSIVTIGGKHSLSSLVWVDVARHADNSTCYKDQSISINAIFMTINQCHLYDFKSMQYLRPVIEHTEHFINWIP